jgi:site-specific DNA-methyltransferase (adenine-specific)
MTLLQGDCLELMKEVPDKSIDLILCDLPYGTTKCKWDTIIPFDKLWEQYNRIIKDNGAIVLFGNEPFSSQLRLSNLKNYKYDWVWDKKRGSNFATVKIRPFNSFENIMVFYKRQPTYNPQMWKSTPYTCKQGYVGEAKQTGLYRDDVITVNNGDRYPLTILSFSKETGLHPTQKPVALLEYLIKTYTNEGDTVLDNCMGSGSTGVACKNTNREFIGMELDENYYKIACERLSA